MRVVISVLMLSMLIAVSLAEIPQVITYQGKVSDAGGAPVADGDYTMTFTIYDAASGGSSLWSSGALTVPVSGGVFSVLLGDTGQPALSLNFSADYWVEIDIAGDVQTPRVRLGSVGYAYMASGLVPGTEVAGAVTSGTSAAIKGRNTATSGTNYGVYGGAASPAGYAGYFQGNARVTGNLMVDGALSGSGIGDITAVIAGTGLTGGATSGDVTLHVAVPLELSTSTVSPTISGANLSTAGVATGVVGTSASIAGRGLYGVAFATAGNTYGVRGESASTWGVGVYGLASATWGTNCGVRGESASTWGRGVHGLATAATGTTYGGYFRNDSDDGYGVYSLASATSGITYGVRGESSSTAGRGVSGNASATSGVTFGGDFGSASTAGRGVYGLAIAGTGTTYGVYGQSLSTAGRGVYGVAIASTGTTYGVYGESASSGWGFGVYGVAGATTGLTCGVFGRTNSADGYGMYYQGGLAGTGTKSCVVSTSQGPTLMYCQESPENWFEDFGEGRLVNGRARIELDPLFLETVTVDEANPMKVFVEVGDECNGVFVRRGLAGFDVVELHGGTSSIQFCYRVVAKRKGFEEKRLDYCKAAETDSYLFPELREKEESAVSGHELRTDD